MLNQSSVSVAQRVSMATFDPNNENLKSKCKMFKTNILCYRIVYMYTLIRYIYYTTVYMYKLDKVNNIEWYLCYINEQQ